MVQVEYVIYIVININKIKFYITIRWQYSLFVKDKIAAKKKKSEIHNRPVVKKVIHQQNFTLFITCNLTTYKYRNRPELKCLSNSKLQKFAIIRRLVNTMKLY